MASVTRAARTARENVLARDAGYSSYSKFRAARGQQAGLSKAAAYGHAKPGERSARSAGSAPPPSGTATRPARTTARAPKRSTATQRIVTADNRKLDKLVGADRRREFRKTQAEVNRLLRGRYITKSQARARMKSAQNKLKKQSKGFAGVDAESFYEMESIEWY